MEKSIASVHLGLVEKWLNVGAKILPSKQETTFVYFTNYYIIDRWDMYRYNVCVKQESAIPPSPKYKLQPLSW